jgi:hypothetical protein
MPIHTKDGEILLKNGAIRDGSSESCCCPLPCFCGTVACGPMYAIIDGVVIPEDSSVLDLCVADDEDPVSGGIRNTFRSAGVGVSVCVDAEGKTYRGVEISIRTETSINFGGFVCVDRCGAIFQYRLDLCDTGELRAPNCEGEYVLINKFAGPFFLGIQKLCEGSPVCRDFLSRDCGEECLSDCWADIEPEYVGHNPLP